MQENKFEKQVREHLEELEFRPTDPVWRNVAASIRRRKRRRLVAYFSLIALLGIGGYLLIGQRNSMTEKNDPAFANAPANKPIPDAVPIGKPSSEAAGVNESFSTNAVAEKISSAVPAGKPVPADVLITGARSAGDPGRQPGKTPADKEHSAHTKETGRPVNNPSIIDNSDPQPSIAGNNGQTEAPQPPPTHHIQQTENIDVPTVLEHSLSSETAANTGELVNDNKIISSVHDVENNIIINVKRKISWAVEVSGGAGRRRDEALPGVFDGQKSSIELIQGSPLMAPPGVMAITRALPSESKTGLGFSAGVSARIPLTKKLNLLAGMRYHYQSEEIMVGRVRDSLLYLINIADQNVVSGRQYAGTPQSPFINRYHFLQMPVALEISLNKGRKTPIFWDLGMAPGFLLGSNALVYDSAGSGIYYKDRTVFNRFQLAATTALSIQLGTSSRFRWTLGPELRLNLTPLSDDRYDPRQYMIYGGLRTRMFF